MEGRRKMAIRCMAIAIVTVVLTGCSDKIIYPDGWIIPKEVETGNLEETENSGEAQSETAVVETEAPSLEDEAEKEVSDEPDNYYFDLSGSMKRSPQVTEIYACAMRAGAGGILITGPLMMAEIWLRLTALGYSAVSILTGQRSILLERPIFLSIRPVLMYLRQTSSQIQQGRSLEGGWFMQAAQGIHFMYFQWITAAVLILKPIRHLPNWNTFLFQIVLLKESF